MRIPPRTIMDARECKHCLQQIYLQYLPIPGCRVNWIAFNISGELHSCQSKLLDSGTQQIIQEFIEQMNPVNNDNSIIVHKLDTLIEILVQIKDNM